MKIGYFLSSEEWGPRELVAQAVKAEQAGFEGLWISDHYHPWNDEQGHSPFVWSTIGAIAQATDAMKLTTAVTCPTIRIHPAIVAQAAATSAVLLEGRFCLGLGSGEALNEHILGDRWPGADERLEMLEEAVDVIRTLWQGGIQDYRGRHYRVEHARVYDLPDRPPPIVISGFGSKSVELAARIGDGYCTVGPDADAVKQFRSQAATGTLIQGGLKVCWGEDEAQARTLVHRLWPNDALPGELAQILPAPNISSRPARWSPKTRSPPTWLAAQTSSGMSKRSPPIPTRGSMSSMSTRSAPTRTRSSLLTAIECCPAPGNDPERAVP
jgi:G6PDH family F420-dependent oxidoreductase